MIFNYQGLTYSTQHAIRNGQDNITHHLKVLSDSQGNMVVEVNERDPSYEEMWAFESTKYFSTPGVELGSSLNLVDSYFPLL